MKKNLFDSFPDRVEDVDAFEELLHKPSPVKPPKEGFDKLMAAREALERLEKYKRHELNPTSLGVLIETVCDAFQKKSLEIAKKLSIKSETWRKVLSGEYPPTRIPATQYALLGQSLALGYRVMADAILGSSRLNLIGAAHGHIRFARSGRKTQAHSRSLRPGFEELSVKAGQSRSPETESPEVKELLEELRNCLK